MLASVQSSTVDTDVLFSKIYMCCTCGWWTRSSFFVVQRKKAAHERQKENFESGGWSSGKKWADDAPGEGVDEESVTLMAMGACGAFVHGLEDEYMGAKYFIARRTLLNTPNTCKICG